MEKYDDIQIYDAAKLKLYFSKGQTLIMIDKEKNHYKFWNIEKIDGTHFKTSWGRIGKKIQSITKESSKYHINNEIESLIRNKINKGYKEL